TTPTRPRSRMQRIEVSPSPFGDGETREGGPNMTLLALDVNATRVRVLHGSSREVPPLVLEGTETELPLAVSVEGPHPQPGPAGLAVALTAHAQQAWDGLGLGLDIDDHALTWSAVLVEDGRARVLHAEPQTTLGLRTWKERLLAVAADACIRRSRRDPRDSAD